MFNLIIFLAFCFGSIIGSFLNVVILRLPKDEKLTGRSHCPKCGRILTVLELFPIFSFLIQGGKCRGCKLKISSRYAVIEIITGILFALAMMLFYPFSVLGILLLVKVWLVISILIVVFTVDFEHFLILDNVLITGLIGTALLNIAMGFVSLISFWSWGGWVTSFFVAALACPLPFFLIWFFSQGRLMGFGDVKLAIFLGMALGWPVCWVGVLLGIFLGGLTAVVLLITGVKTLKSKVPFGTFLSVGAAIALFYGASIWHWYVSLIGL